MKRRGVIAWAILMACSLTAQAQWVQTGGPQGGIVTSMAVDDSHVVATIYQDIYNHEKGEWNVVGSVKSMGGLYPNEGGSTLLIRNGVLIANTRTGMFRSTDFGRTWTSAGMNGALFGDRSSFYALRERVIHHSKDGILWTQLGTVPEFTSVPFVFNGDFYTTPGYGSGILRSTDQGITWETLEPEFPFIEGREGTAGVGVTFGEGAGNLYASVGGGQIFSSKDGITWKNITIDLPNWISIYSIEANDKEIYITTNMGLYRFNGLGWSKIDVSTVRSVHLRSDGAIIPTYGGVYRVPAGSIVARMMEGNLIRGGAYELGSIGSIVFANTSDGVFRTIDKGATWEKVYDYGFMQFVNHGSLMFATNGIAHISTDSGATWQPTGPKYDFDWDGPEYRVDVTGMASDGEVVYMGVGTYLTDKGANGGWSSGGMWRSTDNGITWQEVVQGIPDDGCGTYAPVGDVIATKEYVLISTAAGIYRSTNQGGIWYRSMSGLPLDSRYLGATEITKVGEKIYLRMGFDLFESADGGVTWSPMSVPVPEGYSWMGVASVVDDKLYLYSTRHMDTTYTTALFTFDGKTWTDITATQPEGVELASFVRAGDYLYAGSNQHGVWRQYDEKSHQVSSVIPTTVAANGSLTTFPNPMRSTADVRFDLASAGNATLDVINSIGERVAVAHDGALGAGEQTIRVDMSTLPAGRYMLRLRTEKGVEYGSVVKE